MKRRIALVAIVASMFLFNTPIFAEDADEPAAPDTETEEPAPEPDEDAEPES